MLSLGKHQLARAMSGIQINILSEDGVTITSIVTAFSGNINELYKS
jgi:hypothetical protein